jgi:hypothetical protein
VLLIERLPPVVLVPVMVPGAVAPTFSEIAVLAAGALRLPVVVTNTKISPAEAVDETRAGTGIVEPGIVEQFLVSPERPAPAPDRLVVVRPVIARAVVALGIKPGLVIVIVTLDAHDVRPECSVLVDTPGRPATASSISPAVSGVGLVARLMVGLLDA